MSRRPSLALLFPESHSPLNSSANHSFIHSLVQQLFCEHLCQALRTEHTGGPHTWKPSQTLWEGLQDRRLTNESQSRLGVGKTQMGREKGARHKLKGQGRLPNMVGSPIPEGAGQGRDDVLLGEGSSGCHILTSTKCTQHARPTQPFIELLHLAWEPQLREVPSVDQHIAVGHLDGICP